MYHQYHRRRQPPCSSQSQGTVTREKEQNNNNNIPSISASSIMIAAVQMSAVLLVVLIAIEVPTVSGFAPNNNNNNNNLNFINTRKQYQKTTTSSLGATKSKLMTLPTVPNPFHKLPWNVDKIQKRKEWQLKLERSKLHRELGIAEDATYEKINEATEKMIARAGDDMKRKIQIEVIKDKILQIRLNERLAGLVSDIVTKDAKDQSTFEESGNELEEELAEDAKRKNQSKEWSPPAWTQGLIVKPDKKQINGQIRLWGILTAMGLALPPFIGYSNRFTWMVCIAQLSFRGMPKESTEGGGLALSFGRGPGSKSHLKTAWLIGLFVSFTGAVVTYSLMPSFLKNQRMTPFYAYAMRNFIYGVACCYFQPYKNK